MAGLFERLEQWIDRHHQRNRIGAYIDPPGRYFHATTEEAAQAILCEGFSLAHRRRGATLGYGVYLGPYAYVKGFGPVVVAVELDCPIHDWDGPECRAVRAACGWRDNLTTYRRDWVQGRGSYLDIYVKHIADEYRDRRATTPHPGPQLMEAMLAAGVRAIRFDFGVPPVFGTQGAFEICVYDLSAIRVVDGLLASIARKPPLRRPVTAETPVR